MRLSKRFLFLSIFTVILSLTTISWAVTSQFFNANVTLAPAAPGSVDGKPYSISTAGSTTAYSLHNGRPQKIGGVELYKLSFASLEYADSAKIFLSVQNQQNNIITKGKWWIDVGVFYSVPPTSTIDPETDLAIINADGTTSYYKHISGSDMYFNETKASNLLQVHSLNLQNFTLDTMPSLYLFASYLSPGNNTPPGQQATLSDLTFNVMIRE